MPPTRKTKKGSSPVKRKSPSKSDRKEGEKGKQGSTTKKARAGNPDDLSEEQSDDDDDSYNAATEDLEDNSPVETAKEASNKRKQSPSKAKGKAKDDRNYNTDKDDDDISATSSEDSQEITSPRRKGNAKQASSPKTKTTNPTTMDEDVQAELRTENEKLKKILENQTLLSKQTKALQAEAELVSLKLKAYVKEKLWKQVKFITDDDILQKALSQCAKNMNVADTEKTEWKLRHTTDIQVSLNTRRNNCSQDLGKAYSGKFTNGCLMIQLQ